MILWIIKKITAVLQDGPKLHWHTKVPQENSIHVFFFKLKKKKKIAVDGVPFSMNLQLTLKLNL